MATSTLRRRRNRARCHRLRRGHGRPRAALRARPWIFREIAHFLATGETLPEPTLLEVRDILLAHLEHLHAFYGEASGVRIARKHLGWYAKDRPENHAFRAVVNRAQDASTSCADAGLLRCVGRGCRAGIAGRGLTSHAIAAVRRDNAFPLDRHVTMSSQPHLHGFSRGEQERLSCARRAWPNPPCSTTSTCPARSATGSRQRGRRADRDPAAPLPDLHVTCVDLNQSRTDAARENLGSRPWLDGRYELRHADATDLHRSKRAASMARSCAGSSNTCHRRRAC